MRTKFIAAAAALMLLPQLAFALSIDDAKAQGLVGETPGGYLAAVKPSGDVNALVGSINNQRRAEYDRIAKQNGQPRSVIESLAAKKAYELTQPGHYVQGADGSWKRK